MRIARPKFLLLLVFCLTAATGCAEITPWWVPLPWEPPNDTIEGLVTPAQRIKTYRQLAENASQATPEEQQRAAQQLAAAIADERDPLVRAQIVRSIAVFPTPKAAQVLTAALEDVDADGRAVVGVRVAACDGWARRGGPEAVRALAGAVQHQEDIDVRLAATRALGRLGAAERRRSKDENGEIVQALSGALQDADPALQSRAMQSLESTTGRYYGRDAELWLQYARGANPPQKERSLAERLGISNLF